MIIEWALIINLRAVTVQVACSSQEHANGMIQQWRAAVEAGDRFIEFAGRMKTRNLTLVSEIVAMSVINFHQMDELVLEGLKARKRIEQEAEYDQEDDK